MTPAAKHIIKASPRDKRVIYRQGNTADIIRTIMYADTQSAQYIQPGAAAYLKGKNDRETLRNIYDFVKNNLRYQPDRPGHEIIRSPAYLYDTRTGDCKSFSIAIGALCRAMGIPYRFRFSAMSPNLEFHHVYVMATDRQTGKDIAMDAVYKEFNKQPQHEKRKDIRPGSAACNAAISGMGALTDGSWILIVLLAMWLLMAKKIK